METGQTTADSVPDTELVGYDEVQTAIQETATPESAQPPAEEAKEQTGDGDAPPDDAPPPSGSAEPKGYETTLELPRDILTAYILIRMNGTWDKLSIVGKSCIMVGFVFSFLAQFTVFGSLITGTVYQFVNEYEVDFDGKNFLYNLVSIAALFMYLWKDVMAYYNSVWFYVKMQEKEHLDLTPQALTAASPGKLLSFGQFRVFLVATFVLYAGFALYSLVEIAAEESIADKLEVAINIFFVLEIDDWACELFVLGPGVLDDDDFDVDVTLKENDETHTKNVEKRLKWITFLLLSSIAGCYGTSYYHVALEDE